MIIESELTRLIEAKLLLDQAQKEFDAAVKKVTLMPLDEERVVILGGQYYIVCGRDGGRPPAISTISAPRDLGSSEVVHDLAR